MTLPVMATILFVICATVCIGPEGGRPALPWRRRAKRPVA